MFTIEAIDGYFRIWKEGKIIRLTCTLQEAERLIQHWESA